MKQRSNGIEIGDTAAMQPLTHLAPWIIRLSVVTFLFTLPHSFEDFVYGIPGRFGLSVMAAGMLLSLAFVTQVVGVLLILHRRQSGLVITLGIALFWFIGAVADHLHDVLVAWPYREGIISKVMEIAIIVSMALLTAISAIALFQARRSYE